MRTPPFNTSVPYTNTAAVTEWRSQKDAWDGRPVVLFVLFSDQHKTNLVDALWYDGFSIAPVLDGLFDKNLKSVSVGDSMARAFRLLGRRECDYFQASPGKWSIKTYYRASSGESIELEADAGTGVISRVTVWKNL